MDIKDYRTKGFTLVELLMVVAIIGILVAIAVPVFSTQLEKSRNAVDMHNAKSIASSISYYFMSNPDAVKELQEQCDASGSHHCVQVEVMSNTAISQILRPALLEAGLINSTSTSTAARFNEITCKSKTKWVGYRIVVSNYNNGKPGEIQIRFWGLPAGTTAHSSNSWSLYNGTDTTGFKNAMEGSQ